VGFWDWIGLQEFLVCWWFLDQVGRVVQGGLEIRLRRGNISICVGYKAKIKIKKRKRKMKWSVKKRKEKKRKGNHKTQSKAIEGREEQIRHMFKDRTRVNHVEDVSPKPSRGSKRRDEGFDKQPQRLPRVATFSR
jgi:hypothetical protein